MKSFLLKKEEDRKSNYSTISLKEDLKNEFEGKRNTFHEADLMTNKNW